MSNGYYAPVSRFRSPLSYGLPMLWPFRGLLGSALLLAGVIAIANMLAPQLVEHALPNWRSQYGILICVAVVLGFLRSILRLFMPIASLGFWIVAIFALSHLGMPQGFQLPSTPAFISRASQAAPVTVSQPSTKTIHGTKALPDSAFFPASSQGTLGALSKIPGLSTVKSWLR